MFFFFQAEDGIRVCLLSRGLGDVYKRQPIAYEMGWEIGITPSTVLVSHLLVQESTSPDLLVNEFLLFAIGTGFALLVNLYMPSREEEIHHYHTLVEEKLKDILQRFKYYLSRGDGRNRAQLVEELDTLLEEALKLVYLDHSDHLFHQTDYHIHYFEMRQRQSRILRNMAQQINTCHLAASESLILAQLFSKIAGQLSQTNPCLLYTSPSPRDKRQSRMPSSA